MGMNVSYGGKVIRTARTNPVKWDAVRFFPIGINFADLTQENAEFIKTVLFAPNSEWREKLMRLDQRRFSR